MSSLNAHLKSLLADLTAELPEVTERRMFGSDAFFANGSIFCMAWDGRVLVKLPDPARFEVAIALEGSGPFDPMKKGRTMTGWVAMPEAMHDDVEALQPWLEEAHRAAMSRPPKTAKKLKAPRARAPRTGTTRATRTSRAGGRKAGR
ncbi:MAG TPA: TfoX/Sxy family protein [Archangium sp.]